MANPKQRPLRIGVSSCIMHEDRSRNIYNGRPLLYLEQSMSDWIMAQGALPLMIPASSGKRHVAVGLADFIGQCDGIILQGGVDVFPGHYGEEPLRPEWSGDTIRDVYEMEIVRLCVALDVPILGICRGHQVINVAMGGSLYQDINFQIPGSLLHRNADVYEYNRHEVHFAPGSHLQSLYPGQDRAMVPSVHHQAVKQLAPGFVVEARSVVDDVVGVQWHPEFQDDRDASLLPTGPLFADFTAAIRARMTKASQSALTP
jgi:putative glutamine amidotransferase